MEENTENKDTKTDQEMAAKITRLVITKEAEAAVSEVMSDINQGFEAGKATKIDVASYMLLWFKDHAPSDAKLGLRMQLADEMTMLESIVKRAKVSGELPPVLKEALAQHFFGSDAAAPKKGKKNLKSEYITDIRKESEAA